MIHEPVSVEKLQKAIAVWEAANHCYKSNMIQIKKDHPFSWFLRPSYWRNERYYTNGFVGVIRRRVQLQTAIKEQKESA